MKIRFVKTAIVFIIFLFIILVFAFSSAIAFPIYNSVKGYAEESTAEVNLQYEIKIKVNDHYYWISDDGCGLSGPCDCQILSTEPVALAVGEEFYIDSFIQHLGRGEWNVEGKYITGFCYENSNQQCIFASNIVLELPFNSPVIEPIYENETYTIAFDGNGADGAPINPEIYQYGNELILPVPQRTDYTFLGWQYNGEDFDYAEMPDVSDGFSAASYAITLSAKWRYDYYMVTFVQENGSITQRVKYGEAIGTLPEIYETGYPFISFRAEGSNKDYIASTIWDIDSDTTLYIQRGNEPIEYSVTYDGAGGTLTGTVATYNVEQLPLQFEYNATREFDYIDYVSLNGEALINNTIPVGIIGNIIIRAVWKADRYSSSSHANVSNETYSSEYCVVNCSDINLVAVRTLTIKSSVKEIAFVGNYDDYVISKKILVESRSEPLIIHIKELNWGSYFGDILIDATACPELTLNCVGENRLHGGIILGEVDEYLAVIKCRNLTITGDSLTVVGSPAVWGYNGGIGICGVGIDEDGETVTINWIRIEIDYLYVEGGNGGDGDNESDRPNGGDGGTGIFYFIIIIAEHPGQTVTFMGGAAGEAAVGGVDGEAGDDHIGIILTDN